MGRLLQQAAASDGCRQSLTEFSAAVLQYLARINWQIPRDSTTNNHFIMTIMSNNKDLTGKVAIGTPLEAHPTPKLEATTTHQNTQILTKSYLHSHRLQPWHRRLNNSQVRLTGRRCRNKLHFIQGSRRIRRSPSPRIWRSRHNPQSRRIKRDRSTSDVRDPDERIRPSRYRRQ